MMIFLVAARLSRVTGDELLLLFLDQGFRCRRRVTAAEVMLLLPIIVKRYLPADAAASRFAADLAGFSRFDSSRPLAAVMKRRVCVRRVTLSTLSPRHERQFMPPSFGRGSRY